MEEGALPAEDVVVQLKQHLGLSDVVSPPPEPPKTSGRSNPFKEMLRKVVRRALGWYVEPSLQNLREAFQMSVATELEEARRRSESEAEAVRINRINIELLKGEVRAVQQELERFGLAIAPGGGLGAAQQRLAELRERLNVVERRTRAFVEQGSAGSADRSVREVPDDTPSENLSSSGFDYVGFECRFRGDPQTILATLTGRYLETLSRNAPVLDVGCGRGELLEALTKKGVECSGVELNKEMVVEARARGLEVAETDAVSHLRNLKPGSLGSIIAVHVVEHLQLDYLIEFLDLCGTRLRPGGILVMETPNPMSLIVLGNSYLLDPTHVRPLHPSLLGFLCESAGFRELRFDYYSPATDYQLARIEDEDAPRWVESLNESFEKLNRSLFGPQEYSITAKTPPAKRR